MAKCYSHLSVAAKRVTNFPRTSWTSEINTNLQPKPGTLGLGTVPWYWPLQNQNQLCTQKNLGETVSLLAHLWDAREYISLLTPGSLSLLSPQAANPSSPGDTDPLWRAWFPFQTLLCFSPLTQSSSDRPRVCPWKMWGQGTTQGSGSPGSVNTLGTSLAKTPCSHCRRPGFNSPSGN